MRHFSVLFVLFLIGVSFAAAAEQPTITVLLCEEGDEAAHYDAYNRMPQFMEQLGKENNWNVVIVESKKYAEMPSLEILAQTDVLVVFVRRIGLPKQGMEALKKYVSESGKGLVAIRTACHGFAPGKMPEGCEKWDTFDKEVLGGNYHGHGHNDIGSEVWNVKEQKDSPILKGVKPEVWHSETSVYFNDPLAADCTVYQYAGSSEKGKMPLTWTRMHKNTRVAYTALGHKTDFALVPFKTLVANLINWSMEKP